MPAHAGIHYPQTLVKSIGCGDYWIIRFRG